MAQTAAAQRLVDRQHADRLAGCGTQGDEQAVLGLPRIRVGVAVPGRDVGDRLVPVEAPGSDEVGVAAPEALREQGRPVLGARAMPEQLAADGLAAVDRRDLERIERRQVDVRDDGAVAQRRRDRRDDGLKRRQRVVRGARAHARDRRRGGDRPHRQTIGRRSARLER
jgi:hypothetical protein